jgi:uncharacterized protein with HEPN domain
MPRDHGVYLIDILEAVRRILSYTEGMSLVDFEKSLVTIDAVVRNLEVIGEAAGRIPGEIQAEAPDIEWRKIIALRNVLAHEYFGVNTKIVWDVVVNKLRPLERASRRILEDGGR